jgi:hypothetical protein
VGVIHYPSALVMHIGGESAEFDGRVLEEVDADR